MPAGVFTPTGRFNMLARFSKMAGTLKREGRGKYPVPRQYPVRLGDKVGLRSTATQPTPLLTRVYNLIGLTSNRRSVTSHSIKYSFKLV
jgi:hypothetical protein